MAAATTKEFPPVEVTLPWAVPDGEARTFQLLFTDEQKHAYHRSIFNQYPWKKALAAVSGIPPREKG